MPEKILYTAEARSTGDGRNGHVTSSDGRLDFDLAFPKEMGGTGEGSNPEQLFAAGYAACFHNALRITARKARADVDGSTVTARVASARMSGVRPGRHAVDPLAERAGLDSTTTDRGSAPGLPMLPCDPRKHHGRSPGRLNPSATQATVLAGGGLRRLRTVRLDERSTRQDRRSRSGRRGSCAVGSRPAPGVRRRCSDRRSAVIRSCLRR